MNTRNFDHINTLASNKTPFIFIIDYLKQQVYVEALSQLNADVVKFHVNGISNSDKGEHGNKKFTFSRFPVSYDTYSKGYQKVYDNLKKGNSYLTNFTMQTPINTNLTLLEIFEKSTAKYKLWFNNNFVVFSPETFIKIKGSKIYSYPMKGTIDGSIENAADIILNNAKETAEHATIVDLIRNDLSRIATNVTVDKYRYIDTLQTTNGELLQVSSEISGDLPENYNDKLGDILNQLLPAGSISGAPKEKTMEIIQAAEDYQRNFYTGVFGIFDGSNLDCGVMIRFIENNNGQFFFKSGGGITINSKPKDEYEEMIKKVYLPF